MVYSRDVLPLAPTVYKTISFVKFILEGERWGTGSRGSANMIVFILTEKQTNSRIKLRKKRKYYECW